MSSNKRVSKEESTNKIALDFRGAKVKCTTMPSTSFQNMPVVKYDYLPVLKGVEKYIRENPQLTISEKVLELERVINIIELDLYKVSNEYNDETKDYCKNTLIPEINAKIKAYELGKKFIPTIQAPKHEIKEIALKYVYEGLQITRSNADAIISDYGLKSGEKLYQKFSFYSSRANRKGDPGTKKKLANKIKLLGRVILLLKENNRELAIDEMKALEIIYKEEYCN